MPPSVSDDAIEAAILRLVEGSDRSIAPIEAARLLDPGEQSHRMIPAVRRIAARLAAEGRVVFLRKGRVVSPDGLKGVYRLGRSEVSADGAGNSSAV